MELPTVDSAESTGKVAIAAQSKMKPLAAVCVWLVSQARK